MVTLRAKDDCQQHMLCLFNSNAVRSIFAVGGQSNQASFWWWSGSSWKEEEGGWKCYIGIRPWLHELKSFRYSTCTCKRNANDFSLCRWCNPSFVVLLFFSGFCNQTQFWSRSKHSVVTVIWQKDRQVLPLFLSVLLLFVSFHTFTKYFFNTVLTCIHFPVQVLWSLQSCEAVFRLGARVQWPRKIIWVKFRLLVHQLTISALTISTLLRCWQLGQRIVGNAWAVLDPVPE